MPDEQNAISRYRAFVYLLLMSHASITRRQTLTALTAAVGGAILPQSAQSAVDASPFTLCLNMSTIRGHKLGFANELETAAKAGFRSVEIWIDTFQNYLKTNSITDIKKRLADLGLTVENAIGFAPWIVDDVVTRQTGTDQLRREMDLLAQIGCLRIATPPVGAHLPNHPALDLRRIAERYRTILDLGNQTGVVPQLELWGFSKNLSKLSEVLYVAAESGHPSARLLLDIYHLYKGGTAAASLPLVGKPAIDIFHVNDYPANLTRDAITDADRVFPGDGVAPIRSTLALIKRTGKPIVLSLEVFNESYYAENAQVLATKAFAKMNALVAD